MEPLQRPFASDLSIMGVLWDVENLQLGRHSCLLAMLEIFLKDSGPYLTFPSKMLSFTSDSCHRNREFLNKQAESTLEWLCARVSDRSHRWHPSCALPHVLFWIIFSNQSISGNQILETSPRQPEVWKPSGQFQFLADRFKACNPRAKVRPH